MNTVGSRVKFRRRQLKMTQKDVAEYVGVSASAVTQWENDATVPSSESLLKLATVLQSSPDWLLKGQGEIDAPSRINAGRSKSVPLISWVQAGAWTDVISDKLTASNTEWIETTAKVSDNSFALKVKGASMTSTGALSIPDGSIVIVDPEFGFIDEANGRIVVAQVDGSSQATIKKLEIDGPNHYLMPLNPDFKPILIDSSCKLVGVVKQIIIDFH
ncbi:S24 family peptidase [Rahnella sp. R3(2024)]|uniref:LexA family protein n=1 Tax=Rahnella sp. R3(2024) TaxID=3163550 RepID=UPI0036EDB42A